MTEDTTTIEITESQRQQLREIEPTSAKRALGVLLERYDGRRLTEGRVREIVREEVRMEALE